MNSSAVLGLENYIPAAATKQDRGERNELTAAQTVAYRVSAWWGNENGFILLK